MTAETISRHDLKFSEVRVDDLVRIGDHELHVHSVTDKGDGTTDLAGFLVEDGLQANGVTTISGCPNDGIVAVWR